MRPNCQIISGSVEPDQNNRQAQTVSKPALPIAVTPLCCGLNHEGEGVYRWSLNPLLYFCLHMVLTFDLHA